MSSSNEAGMIDTNKLKLETICETQLDNYTSEYFITGVLEDP